MQSSSPLPELFKEAALARFREPNSRRRFDLACLDNEKGIRTSAVLLLETGGVRLQEANLGLAAVVEIISSIIALRRYAPVISVTAGTVGCFGGVSMAAGVSSYVVMTREARLGLNGPEGN